MTSTAGVDIRKLDMFGHTKKRLAALDELVTGEGPRDWRMGVCVMPHSRSRGPKLGYKLRGGFGYRWMPDWAQRAIVACWNWGACRYWGHDEFDEFAVGIPNGKVICVSCSKTLR